MTLLCFILFVFSWKQTEQLNKPHKKQTDIPDMFLPSSHIGDHCKLTIVKNAQWVRTQQNACFICVPSLSSRKIIYILPGYVEIQIGVVTNFSACTQWSWDVDQRKKTFSESEKLIIQNRNGNDKFKRSWIIFKTEKRIRPWLIRTFWFFAFLT